MSVYKRGHVWWICYYFNGKQIREGVSGSRREAEAALEGRKTDIRRGEFRHIPKRERVTFEEAVKEYKLEKAEKRSLGRDETSFKKLRLAFGFKRLDQITIKDVEGYKRKRAGEVSGATTNRELALLKCLFNVAIGNGRVSHNPVKGVKFFAEAPKRGDRVLSALEAWRLVQSAAPHLQPILLVALFTGLRKGDILALRPEDIDLNPDYPVIRLMMQKTGEPLEIPLWPEAALILSRYLKTRPASTPYVFMSHRPGRKTGKTSKFIDIKNAFRGALKRADLEDRGYCFHDLRRTFASIAYRRGEPLLTISKLLGHRSVKTTERYLGVRLDEKRQTINAIGEELGCVLSVFTDPCTDYAQVRNSGPVKLLPPAS